ncbi:MAG: hypothetical protein PHO01_12945 [Desulfotomaculaceae bacterium]|nr:hypothetical protein [Desulfotomaculaceae bacterium]
MFFNFPGYTPGEHNIPDSHQADRLLPGRQPQLFRPKSGEIFFRRIAAIGFNIFSGGHPVGQAKLKVDIVLISQ